MATSELLVTFALTRASDYTLDGSLDGFDGLASFTLEGPAGAVHEQRRLLSWYSEDQTNLTALDDITVATLD